MSSKGEAIFVSGNSSDEPGFLVLVEVLRELPRERVEVFKRVMYGGHEEGSKDCASFEGAPDPTWRRFWTSWANLSVTIPALQKQGFKVTPKTQNVRLLMEKLEKEEAKMEPAKTATTKMSVEMREAAYRAAADETVKLVQVALMRAVKADELPLSILTFLESDLWLAILGTLAGNAVAMTPLATDPRVVKLAEEMRIQAGQRAISTLLHQVLNGIDFAAIVKRLPVTETPSQ